jgi:hypothetical protein
MLVLTFYKNIYIIKFPLNLVFPLKIVIYNWKMLGF